MGMLSGDPVIIVIHEKVAPGQWSCTFCSGTRGVLKVKEEWDIHIAKSSTATVKGFSVAWGNDMVHMTVDEMSGGCLMLHPSISKGPFQIAELFGGLSGWSHAAHEFHMPPIAIIERDHAVASACAKTWDCPIIDAKTFFEQALSGEIKKVVVVHTCVSDPLIWNAFGILNVGFAFASPPCPPWSGAGSERGLTSQDGKIFAEMLKLSGQLRLTALMVENVPGITQHPDFQTLLAGAALEGMKMIVNGVHGVHRALPLYRDRWLATFCHVSVVIAEPDVQAVHDFSLASDKLGLPIPGPSLKASDAVHPLGVGIDRTMLKPSVEALDFMRRSDMLPRWLKDRINWTLHDPILRARAISHDGKLSGVMAMYGRQHELPIDHLKAKGLQTVVFAEGDEDRYFSPWEILAALAFPPSTVISKDLTQAFQQVGNAISPVHAWLQIVKTHKLLGWLSPFPTGVEDGDTLKRILDSAIKLSTVSVRTDDVFSMLEPIPIDSPDEDGSQVKKRRVVDEVKATEDDCPTIPATVPFHAIEDTHDTICTRPMTPDTVFHVSSMSTACQGFCKGGIVFLKHYQNNWMVVIHGAVDEKLSVLIMRVLPHAHDCHFEKFMWGRREIQWEDVVICAPPASVTFKPFSFTITCKLPTNEVIYMDGDVTWTMRTIMAFLAAKVKCNPDSLRILFNELPTKECDFAAEFTHQSFTVEMQSFVPGYAMNTQDSPHMKDPGMHPAHEGCHRFVARHPAMKIVRTTVFSKKATVAEIVRKLFPDLTSSVTWTAHVEGTPIPAEEVIAKGVDFEVEWDCFKPLPPTKVCSCLFALPADTSQVQVKCHSNPERWVKTPFKTKAQVLRIHEDVSLMQIAASFVAHSQLDVNITCHTGAQLQDPTIKVQDVPTQDIISFRIAPLIGGAKKGSHDAVKTKVAEVLHAHGVAKDTCTDRATAFLAKADVETIAKADANDAEAFWKAVKDEANRVHFRLVFRNEMLAAKQEGRKKPPAKFNKKNKLSLKPEEFVASATNVVIDMKHFWDGENNVEMLENSRFGHDQKGLAIMELDEADRYACGSSMSLDPLAILVVGRKFAASDSPFAMPAHTISGEPVVIHAALRQFGDRHVTFKAAIPSTEVNCMASTVVEMHIFKAEVATWKECSVPLHYLGVHISAVRGSSLISTWAMKTWSLDRKPVPFRDAAYWHGFLRVPDNILDQVLSRSGNAGIYVSPKDANKRHDERFTVVAIPDCSLNEALKKAATHDKTLGIVKLRDQYGIRCRRENAAHLRAMLLPESAFVASEGVDQDDTIWVLKNMPSEVGKEGVLEALKQSGWDAHPVRAQGQNRWLVAAKKEPESKHFCINGSFVLAEPIKRQREANAVVITAKQVKVDTVMSQNQNGLQVASSTRIQEVKAEISDHLEMKMQAAHAKIEQLSTALEQFQATQTAKDEATRQELAMVRNEQAFAKQKIDEVEASVVQSGQTVIQTMQQMMTQMQQNLESSMKQMLIQHDNSDDMKRPRKDQPDRNDAFATKS